MARAIWNGAVVAESDACKIVEGNHYFPPDALHTEYFVPSDTHTTCAWKGEAHYLSLRVGDETNADAAWTYPDPKPAARNIKDYVAFWKGVQVEA